MRSTRAVVPMLLLVSACSTLEVGRDFDLAAFNGRVQRGVTSQTEVRGWLGAPSGVGVSVESGGERYEEWSYYHGEGRFPKMDDAQLKVLQIKFDRNGVVRAYNWSGERK